MLAALDSLGGGGWASGVGVQKGRKGKGEKGGDDEPKGITREGSHLTLRAASAGSQ